MSKILNIVEYDLVFTTSFEHEFGISGHLYEMIEYYFVSKKNNINSAILLSDGSSIELLEKSIREKYDFTESEIRDIIDHTIVCHRPKIIKANNICLVDGSPRFFDAVIIAENMFLFRCDLADHSYYHNHKSIKKVHLLQDFKLYSEQFNELDIEVVDYMKKLLWNKYIKPANTITNTALLYMPTNCKALAVEEVESIINRYAFDHYLVITSKPELYKLLSSDEVTVEMIPVANLYERFDTYIYTRVPRKLDCSPRFIVECAVFNKDIIYDIDYIDKGVDRRREAIADGVDTLLLTENDFFVEYVKRYI